MLILLKTDKDIDTLIKAKCDHKGDEFSVRLKEPGRDGTILEEDIVHSWKEVIEFIDKHRIGDSGNSITILYDTKPKSDGIAGGKKRKTTAKKTTTKKTTTKKTTARKTTAKKTTTKRKTTAKKTLKK